MDVSSKISAAVSHLAAVGSVSTPPQPRERAGSAPAASGAASAELSRPARLISKLSQLRESDPDQFKQVVSTLASELRSVSEQDSGLGAKLLIELANQLDEAANEAAPTQPETSTTVSAAPDGGAAAPPRAAAPEAALPALRAAVDAYRAQADAHDGGPSDGAFARALASVDKVGVGPSREPPPV